MRSRLAHAARLLLVSAAFAGLWWRGGKYGPGTAVVRNVPAGVATAWYPPGTSFAWENGLAEATLDGQRVGGLSQTASRRAEPVTGFSGPSNVLVAFGPDRRVVGVTILDSGDTAEHVAMVNADPAFREAFVGRKSSGLAVLDAPAVSGATLTAAAAAEAVRRAYGGDERASLWRVVFELDDVRSAFPEADDIRDGVVLRGGEPVGRVAASTDFDVEAAGYAGPVFAGVCYDADGRPFAAVLLRNVENEPYVDYVRQEPRFLDPLWEIEPTEMPVDADGLREIGVEGVSGATMTSMALAEAAARTVRVAAERKAERFVETPAGSFRLAAGWTLPVVAVGCLLPFVRGRRRLRWVWPVVCVAVLGVWQGDMLSLAMLSGWASTRSLAADAGLAAMAAAAFVIPAATGRNVYCSHVCPHGALQQLLKNRRLKRGRWPRWLESVPIALLLIGLALAFAGRTAAVVGLEAFDAWSWPAAGWATLAVFGVGLVASLFKPMAYCRYGCPTGALLRLVRRR